MRKIVTRALLWLLSLLAKAVIERYHPRMVAITGSVGKTTVKEMTAWVLASKFRVGKNPQNANTEWGITATIIDPQFSPVMTDDGQAKITVGKVFELIGVGLKNITAQGNNYPEILVLELAADRPGDIAWFNERLKYNVAVVTNVGQVHLEFYNSQEHLRGEKLSIAQGLKRDSLLIINKDLNQYVTASGRFRQQSFIAPVYKTKGDMASYLFNTEAGEVKINANHNRGVALSAPVAAKVALELGMELDQITDRIRSFKALKGRFDVIKLTRGITLINDAYNANPDSMKVALLGLQDIAKGRRIAVLGGMRELGEAHDKAHAEIGRFASDKADLFILVGQEGRLMARAITNQTAQIVQVKSITVDEILKYLRDNDTVLIKASKAVGLDKLADDLKSRLS